MEKSQKIVFLKCERDDAKDIILVDSAGQKFYVPQLNDRSTWVYKRMGSVVNYPDKWCIKASVKDGVKFSRKSGGMPVDAERATFLNEYLISDVDVESFVTETPKPTKVESSLSDENFLNFIHSESKDLKPKMLFMSELKWKFLIRNIVRGKNIMMTGPSGCGKTMAAKAAANSLEGYSMEIFNLGSTQDPRITLIGNTQFDTKKGTVFNQSPFVKAIQTPNTVVVLDELSRAHPEAHNILMSVLDDGQRYLRIDEASDSPIIKVAEGVSFIASANIGNEYTATRQLDRAIVDRFTIIEMDTLTKEEEYSLLDMMYPSVDGEILENVAEITSMTRGEVKKDVPKLTNSISTRSAVEIGSLLYDGFTLQEAAEITIYPLFDESGGAESERTYIKQYVQKFVSSTEEDDLFNTENDDLTNPFND